MLYLCHRFLFPSLCNLHRPLDTITAVTSLISLANGVTIRQGFVMITLTTLAPSMTRRGLRELSLLLNEPKAYNPPKTNKSGFAHVTHKHPPLKRGIASACDLQEPLLSRRMNLNCASPDVRYPLCAPRSL